MFFYNAYSLRNGYRSEYASLNMQLWRVTRPLDAAKEWRENPSAYFLERMTAIRAVGKDTLYVSSDPHLKLRWQMDRDSWERSQSEWYAPQVDCEFSFATAETLSCITKALKAAGFGWAAKKGKWVLPGKPARRKAKGKGWSYARIGCWC